MAVRLPKGCATPGFDSPQLHMNIPTEGTQLIHFTADWCGPCRKLKPVLDAVVEETGIERIVADVDDEENKDLTSEFQIMSIPALVLVRDGEKVSDMMGLRSKEVIVDWLKQHGVE